MPRAPHPVSLVARFVTPLAAVSAIAAFGVFQSDPVAAAESGYLALAVGIVLLAAAGVAPGPAAEVVGGSLLAVIAVWTLPPGPARGALAVAVAAGALAVAVARRLAAGGGPEGRERVEGRLPAVPVLALAFGLQALLRGPELLAAGSALLSVVLFVGFPLAGAVAVLALARVHGRRRALLAAAAVLLMGPGFRPATVAALAALAAGSWLVIRDPLAADPERRPGALPGEGPDGKGRARARLAVRLATAAVLLAPFAWDPATAGACLAAGLAAAAPVAGAGRDRRLQTLALAAPVAVLALAWASPARSFAEAMPLASLVVLAVPALALPERERVALSVAALLLSLAAAWGVAVDGALAPAAALAALAVPRRGPVTAVQGGWSAALLAAGSLLAAYPWLRREPLADALHLVGVAPGWPQALVAVASAAFLAGAAAAAFRNRAGRTEPAAAGAALLVVFALTLAHLPAAGATPIAGTGTILDADRSTWTLSVAGTAVSAVVVDTSLANAATLPEGTPVATLRLRGQDGPDRTWSLRVGRETGEWAAARPDLRAEGVPAPAPWTSWVSETGRFFGRRYRSVHRLDEPATADEVEIALRTDLPDGVELTVFHLELRP